MGTVESAWCPSQNWATEHHHSGIKEKKEKIEKGQSERERWQTEEKLLR